MIIGADDQFVRLLTAQRGQVAIGRQAPMGQTRHYPGSVGPAIGVHGAEQATGAGQHRGAGSPAYVELYAANQLAVRCGILEQVSEDDLERAIPKSKFGSRINKAIWCGALESERIGVGRSPVGKYQQECKYRVPTRGRRFSP